MNCVPGGRDVGAIDDAGIGFVLDDLRQHGADIAFQAGRHHEQSVRIEQTLRGGAAGNRNVAHDGGDVGMCEIVEAAYLGRIVRRDGDGECVRCEEFWLLDGACLDGSIHGF